MEIPVGKQNLDSHIADIHDGNKPFSCNICGNNFTTEKDLNNHGSSDIEDTFISYDKEKNLKPKHTESRVKMDNLFKDSGIRKRSLLNSEIKKTIKEV